MSDLSDRFEKHAREKDHLGALISNGDFHNSEDEFPGICGQIRACGDLTKFMISTGVRYFQGRTWPSIHEATLETGDYLKDKIANYLQACFAKGLAVGEHKEEFDGLSHEAVYEKIEHGETHQWASAIFEERIFGDDDLAKSMSDMVVSQFEKFVQHSGLSKREGKQLGAIWEAWKFVLVGSGSAFYVYGIKIGAEMKVDHQFNELAALIGSLDG